MHIAKRTDLRDYIFIKPLTTIRNYTFLVYHYYIKIHMQLYIEHEPITAVIHLLHFERYTCRSSSLSVLD